MTKAIHSKPRAYLGLTSDALSEVKFSPLKMITLIIHQILDGQGLIGLDGEGIIISQFICPGR